MAGVAAPPAVAPPDQVAAFDRVWQAPPGLLGRLRTINNIPVAKRYMATGFAFFLLGGVLALLMRVQLGTPDNTFLDPETYNQIFTMHGTTMMFLFVIPFIEAVANYMLPLMLGTRDLPFPRLTALSYWTYLFGGLLLYSSFLFGVAPDGGWFAYVPLTGREHSPGINMDFWDIGLSVAEIAALGAAAELVVAVLRTRAPGMAVNRLPVFAWAMLVTAFMIIFAFTPLIVGTAMLELDRKGITSFFVPAAGGDALLWQHLFWTFGHPEVYIMFLPAIGIVTHIVQAFARRPVVSYPLVVLSLVATGFLSFGLWVHHMFTTGIAPVAMGYFATASAIIAIPSGLHVAGWVATLWTGRVVWRAPLLFALAGLVIFVIGGITGVMVASVPFDQQVHDSYFVVAHFHYVLIGGSVFPLIAGLFYWLPKITGRLMHEGAGRWSAAVMFVGFNVAFFPMHISGLLGMPRRVYTYQAGLGLDTWNLLSTIGAFALAAGAVMVVANFLWSLRRGAPAGDNPWQADTLEWSQSSPPPAAQFPRLPVVHDRHPLWDEDWGPAPEDPADVNAADAESRAEVARMDYWPTRWRGTLVVALHDGRPEGIAHIPGPSIAPFAMSVGFLALFAAAIVDEVPGMLAGLGVIAVALVLWFRPQRSEAIAMEEMATTDTTLALVQAGPRSNGFWGTVVFVAILATALISVVASFFYLRGHQRLASAGGADPELVWPLVATLALLAGTAAITAAIRASGRARVGAMRVALLVAFTLAAAHLWITGRALFGAGLAPAASARDSAVVLVLGVQALVAAIIVVMSGVALVWAWARPRDARGHAVGWNTGLVYGFAAFSGLVTFVVVFLAPRLT